jgi:DNA-binding transcriptional regulator YhcF (GntR family)
MLIQIDFKSGLPVYLQVVEQIKAAAASGALRPGEPLPSIRPLAEQLRINRNTVAKAYAELEAEGVIETIAGKGCFLKESGSPFSRQTRLQKLAQAIDAAIVQAHHSLVSDRDFLGLVRERLGAFAEKKALEARAQEER